MCLIDEFENDDRSCYGSQQKNFSKTSLRKNTDQIFYTIDRFILLGFELASI